MCSFDLGDPLVFLFSLDDERFAGLTRPEMTQLINFGVGEDVTICDVAELFGSTIGCDGELKLDASKPNGTPRKLMDVSKLTAFGWKAKSLLAAGLRSAYQDSCTPRIERELSHRPICRLALCNQHSKSLAHCLTYSGRVVQAQHMLSRTLAPRLGL